ncbi:CNP1-like family protein [Imhoffiella purpurea]|uniref:CNP1-like uncharacterized domain-containing protein n=1 Tax=Imhoffiella purpurea TaxID=1249627 RepID=W9VC73_9GAMM|nr:CNP1-like family protein [Imhoffiella purpurea]EXJ17039.1 hypothetical protein D779_1862 [Imhoffiella purpurea]
MRRLLPLPIALCLLTSYPSAAGENAFVNDPEPPGPSNITEGTPWTEIQRPLPPWPKDSDLVEFQIDSPAKSPFRFYIDAKNLEVGADQVVRYTLVAETANGTRNLSVEGLRCTPRGKYKIYAYGNANRFAPVEAADWQPLSFMPSERYREDLWRYHFCIPREFRPRPKKDMLRSLRGQIAPRQNTGFQAD